MCQALGIFKSVSIQETFMKNSNTDAVTLLKADHRKVEELFEQYESARSKDKKKTIAAEICMELAVHTKIEEDIFYPACKGKVADELWHEAFVEHDGAKVMLAEIESGSPEDDFFDAKVKVLAELIKHHVKEEERREDGMFAQAKEAGIDFEELGNQLAEAKEKWTAQYEAEGLPSLATPSFTGTKLA
jgi:hemerythrin superfamily protein